MPPPSFLAEALAASSLPSQLAARLREATSSAPYDFASGDDEEPDSDEEADRIIAEHRSRREVEQQAEAEAAKAEAEAAASVPLVEMQPHWGAAARAAAVRRAYEKREDHKEKRLAAIAEAALRAARERSGAAQVLTDADYLSLLMEHREADLLGGVLTEGALQRFSSVASVCSAWHTAVSFVLSRHVRLRHSHMMHDAPKAVHGFLRPSFLALTLDEEHLIVADQHRLSLVPVPPPASESDDEPLASGGSTAADAHARATGAVRTLGTPDGSGGSLPGELYHPHGIALCPDGETIFVADRSNHRIQCMRLRDGAPLDSTPTGVVWGPYDVCMLNRHQLLVCDANNDRVLVLHAKRLDLPPVRCFGSTGSEMGQLDRPRALTLLGQEGSKRDGGEEIVVAEFGNNRCSVWSAAGRCLRTFGEDLPLCQPFGVLNAHGVLLVSEMEGRRLCVFHRDGAPLQTLSPRLCGGLGGLAADADWIYCLDAQKGHLLAFTTRAPLPLGARPEPSPQQIARKKQRLVRLAKAAEAAREAEEVKAAAEKVERAAQAKAETEAEKRLFAFATGPTAYGSSGDGDGGGDRSCSGDGSADGSGDSSADAVLAAWVVAHPEDPVPSIAEKRQLALRSGLSNKEVGAWFLRRKQQAKAQAEAEAAGAAQASAAASSASALQERVRAMAERLAEQLSVRSGEPEFLRGSQNMSEY